MLRSGKISDDALIWRVGLEAWQPVSILLDRSTSVRANGKQNNDLSGQSPLWLSFLVKSLAAFFASAVSIAMHFQSVGSQLFHELERTLGISSVITPIIIEVVFAIISVLMVIFAFKSNIRKSYAGVSGGILSILTVVVAASIVLSMATVHNAKLIIDNDRAAKQINDYSLITDDEARSASLVGAVGVGLFDRIASFDRRIGGIRTFEIESYGGLIDEALKVSELLEEREAVVIARNQCDSACTMIALSSPYSYADQAMSFGFHGVYSLVDSDAEISKVRMKEIYDTVRQRLIDHGVPVTTLDEAGRLSQDQLLYVTASSLFQEGALSGLVVGYDITTP